MSEYQYYEFQAIDRPLGEREMRELRALSTRARITPTSFVNVYSWGNFRGDPNELMEKYFDAFLYVANWGTHRFMLRVPRRLIDAKTASLYCPGEGLSLRTTRKHAVFEFVSDTEEPEDWEEGEGWLSSLIPLRWDILGGDLRSLYLGWLACVQVDELDDDAFEPPVPPGLRDLSGSLRALAEFLRVDADLLEAAAARSAGEALPGPSSVELAEWIGALPEPEKDAWLLRLAEGDAPHLRWELLRRFREAALPNARGRAIERRTVAQLLAAAEGRAEERRRRAAEREAREKARRDRERAEYLDGLAKREDDVWRQVEALIETRDQKKYDRAVELLKDLRDAGARSGRAEEIEARIRRLRELHGKKSTLLRRLAEAGLLESGR